MKRFVHILLSLTLLFTVFVGCNNSGNKTSILPISTNTDSLPTDVAPGDASTYTAASVSFDMVYVPSKAYLTNTDDSGYDTVPNSFQISQTEVTYELWHMVMTWAISHGYSFANAGTEGQDGVIGAIPTMAKYEPVAFINWRDAMVWMNALTEWYNANNHSSNDLECVYYSDVDYTMPIRSSYTTTYTASINTSPGSFDNPYVKVAANGFRLLTSSEWELAARFINDINDDGDITDSGEFYPGNYASGADAPYTNIAETNAVSWNYNPYADTHNVASKRPNALGLYDMSGNIYEWCFNWLSDGVKRQCRGGCWVNTEDYSQVGFVNSGAPYYKFYTLGVRIGRTVNNPSIGTIVKFKRGNII